MSGIICNDDVFYLCQINREVFTDEESNKKNQKLRANNLQINFLVMFSYKPWYCFSINMMVSTQPTCTGVCINAVLSKAMFKSINAVFD